jgi:hypothetical protein
MTLDRDISALDIIRYEEDELGNTLRYRDEDLDEAERIRGNNCYWVTPDPEYADEFSHLGEVEDISYKLVDPRIIAEDSDKGYLITGSKRTAASGPKGKQLLNELDNIIFSDNFREDWAKWSDIHWLYDELDDLVQERLEDLYPDEEERDSVPQFEIDDISEEVEREIKLREFENIEAESFGNLYNSLEESSYGFFVYRCVSVEDADMFVQYIRDRKYYKDYSGVGVYWAFDKDAAECHWGHKSGTEAVVLLGIAPYDSVDILGTAQAMMNPGTGPEEFELRMHEGAPIIIYGVEKGGKDIIFPDDVEMAAKTVSASISRDTLYTTAQDVCDRISYLNCRLFVQLTSDSSKVEALPTVSSPEIGDVLQWGSDPARHWAFYFGEGQVLEVPEWSGELEVTSLQDVENEYGPVEVIRRPDW